MNISMKKQYVCFLNGKRYGSGDMEYMKELFIDYFITCNMYGNEVGEFKVVSKDKLVKESFDKAVDQFGGMLEDMGRN